MIADMIVSSIALLAIAFLIFVSVSLWGLFFYVAIKMIRDS